MKAGTGTNEWRRNPRRVHAHDLFLRADAVRNLRSARVEIAGHTVAETHGSVLLYETGAVLSQGWFWRETG